MQIAITGSSGFIGSALSSKIQFPQKLLVRRKQDLPHLQVIGDLQNKQAIDELVEHTDTLIHLAWASTPWTSNQNVVNDIEANLATSAYLFESFAKKNPQGHIIFASTGGNMYQNKGNIPFREEDKIKPWSSYSINKLAAENYLQLFTKKYQIRSTILRISNPYGSLFNSDRLNGIIGIALSKLSKEEPITIFDSLQSVRDYIHVDDVVEAFNLCLLIPPKRGECELFNISSGIGYRLEEIFSLIEKYGNKKLKKQFDNQDINPSYSVLSSDLFKNRFNWSPQISIEQGIHAMWECTLTKV